MRTIFGFSLMALLVAISAGCGKKDTNSGSGGGGGGGSTTENKPAGIEGEYLIIGSEIFGKKAPAEEIAKGPEAERTVKITKDTLEINEKGKPKSYKYTIDPSKSPKQIDISSPDGKKDPMFDKSYGIYKVEGDTLTLFFFGATEASLRPTEFKTLSMADLMKEGKDEAKDKKKAPGGFAIITLKKK